MCLVNTENLQSYPASRLVDFEKLYEEMMPILPDMEDKIGTFQVQFSYFQSVIFLLRIFYCTKAEKGIFTLHFFLS